MKFYYITFRSVTFAQRGEQVLNRGGLHCTLIRTPKWMEAQGCSYSLRLWTSDIRGAVELLRRQQVAWRRVYVQKTGGQLEEMAV